MDATRTGRSLSIIWKHLRFDDLEFLNRHPGYPPLSTLVEGRKQLKMNTLDTLDTLDIKSSIDGGSLPQGSLLWNIETTARRLGVSESTVRREIASGTLPYVEIRGRKLIDPKAVNQYVIRQSRYNSPCVELMPSAQGESICNSTNEMASIRSHSRPKSGARLDALLKLGTKR